MLYVKVDSNGNATDIPRTYDEIKRDEFISSNKIIPAEGVFIQNRVFEGYACVPVAEKPIPPVGKIAKLQIPTEKNSDGTFNRKWEMVDATDEEKKEESRVKRLIRDATLAKHLDRITPLRWNAMSDADKQSVTDYRQTLLDLPNDKNWPFVEVPDLPEAIKSM